MSSLVASHWTPSTRRPARRAEHPSLREVCLVGESRQSEDRDEAIGPTVHRDGRAYRVAASDGPGGPDPRRYVHLVAVGATPAEA